MCNFVLTCLKRFLVHLTTTLHQNLEDKLDSPELMILVQSLVALDSPELMILVQPLVALDSPELMILVQPLVALDSLELMILTQRLVSESLKLMTLVY
jgi:hypothetical protein